jgi:hypothetical protein
MFAASVHAAGLPDTGQTTCYDGSAMVACTAANSGDTAAYPRQDGRFGRDAKAAAGTLTKIGGGAAGFDYSKVANNGSSLAASATLGTAATDWACTRDNITGLLWEVKTTSGLRSQTHTYTWYSSTGATNAGNAGTVSGGTCQTAGRCDTEKFVTDVNVVALCGFTDWRLPSLPELFTLVHDGAQDPSIDTSYFPNTIAFYFWSGSSYALHPTYAWSVLFQNGETYGDKKTYGGYARLVRGGQF